MTKTPDSIAADNLYTYIGDIGIHHGGMFIRIDESRNYADIVEVIDASNAGIDNETWIESSTAPLDKVGKARIRSAFDCIGMKARDLVGMSRTDKAVQIAYALKMYGYADPNAWNPMTTLTDASEADIFAEVESRL